MIPEPNPSRARRFGQSGACTSWTAARHCRLWDRFRPSPGLTGLLDVRGLTLLQKASDPQGTRPDPIDYSGLRGEGSIPVPLPPPSKMTNYLKRVVFL